MPKRRDLDDGLRLVEVRRGGRGKSIHFGVVVIAAPDGRILAAGSDRFASVFEGDGPHTRRDELPEPGWAVMDLVMAGGRRLRLTLEEPTPSRSVAASQITAADGGAGRLG